MNAPLPSTADLASLAHLLSSQEIRDTAPCVPVNGTWYLSRTGRLRQLSEFSLTDSDLSLWRRTGRGGPIPDECIWSSDDLDTPPTVRQPACRDCVSGHLIHRVGDKSLSHFHYGKPVYTEFEEELLECRHDPPRTSRKWPSVNGSDWCSKFCRRAP